MPDGFDTDCWYWDRRTRKAMYPRRTDDDTVEFVSVWHADEVEDALDGGALAPIEAVGLDRTETTFDLLDSFRTPTRLEHGSDDTEAATPDGDDR